MFSEHLLYTRHIPEAGHSNEQDKPEPDSHGPASTVAGQEVEEVGKNKYANK